MTTDTTTGIDRDDLKALRNADAVILSYSADNGSSIDAIRNDEDEFGERSRRRTIPVRGTMQSAGGQFGLARRSFRSASNHIGSARYHTEWQTITQLLRPSDELVLEFGADMFTNTVVAEANLHADTLVLRVERAGKRMSFLLNVMVTPDGPARMCREGR